MRTLGSLYNVLFFPVVVIYRYSEAIEENEECGRPEAREAQPPRSCPRVGVGHVVATSVGALHGVGGSASERLKPPIKGGARDVLAEPTQWMGLRRSC